MQLRPYQVRQVERLVREPRAGLFLDPGLGKTIITLTALNILHNMMFCVYKTLVIAPKKVADSTWHNEAASWPHLSGLSISRVLGTAKEREIALAGYSQVYVINRDNVQWLVDYYGKEWPFDCVVCDESTSFKNSQSKRFRKLRSVLSAVKRLYILTGTPTAQSVEDLWSQIYLLDGGERLGKTITAFRSAYMRASTYGGFTRYEATKDSGKAVLDKISDLCVSMKAEDYIELPPLVSNVVPVELPEEVKAQYKQYQRDMLIEVENGTLSATNAAVLTGKLLQFCNGAVYDESGRVVRVHTEKLEAFSELITQINEPCLVFYGYQSDILGLEEYAKGKRVRVYRGDADRAAWDSGEVDILIAHPSSCAYGLNLQKGGRHVIWFGLQWSFELNYQGDRRLYRPGTRFDHVFVHRICVRGGMDERVLDVVEGRRSGHNFAMDAMRELVDEK